jgi:hypothetical protein
MLTHTLCGIGSVRRFGHLLSGSRNGLPTFELFLTLNSSFALGYSHHPDGAYALAGRNENDMTVVVAGKIKILLLSQPATTMKVLLGEMIFKFGRGIRYRTVILISTGLHHLCLFFFFFIIFLSFWLLLLGSLLLSPVVVVDVNNNCSISCSRSTGGCDLGNKRWAIPCRSTKYL